MHRLLLLVVSLRKKCDMHAAQASDALQVEFLLCYAMAGGQVMARPGRPGQASLHAAP